MRYFCDKCSADPLVSKVLGINPTYAPTNCFGCGVDLKGNTDRQLTERIDLIEKRLSQVEDSQSRQSDLRTKADDGVGKPKGKDRSSCCLSGVTTQDNLHGTNYFKCNACKMACDLATGYSTAPQPMSTAKNAMSTPMSSQPDLDEVHKCPKCNGTGVL